MSNIPTHFSDEKNKAMMVMGGGAFASLILFIHLIQFAPILAWVPTQEFDGKTWQMILNFFGGYYDPKKFIAGMKFAWAENNLYTIVATMCTVLLSAIPLIVAMALNPFRSFDLIHGDARRGTLRDIREMERRKQVGINGGRYLTLGQWPANKQPVRLIETLSVLVLAPPGTGKSLAPHEPVLMYDGTTKRTGDLVVGDLLMGPDGQPRKVLNTHPGHGPMYRVTPVKGRSFECNGDHILSLRNSKAPRRRALNPLRGSICHVTVEQWIEWSSTQKSKWKQWRAAVDFAERGSPSIDPYFLGIMLGDGSMKDRIAITSIDAEILHAFREEAQRRGMTVKEEFSSDGTTPLWIAKKPEGVYNNELKKAFSDHGLNVITDDKFIPHEYKTGSRETRLQILAGLLDTDGHLDHANNFDFISKSEKLTDDVAFIARSLGLAAYPAPCEKTCTNNGVTGTYYRVCISGHLDMIPNRVPRQKAKSRRQVKDVTNVGFDIEPIGDGDYFGIIVDGDHQYLLDDFTVTHNTANFVIPSILETDDSSFIVNDPKPELFDQTSGWRREIGPVFKIDWSATDDTRDADPRKWVFYPRFNVLSPKLLPPAGTAERDTYLDAIANVLSPSGPGGGKNDYFEQKGRAALVGFLHYICSKIVDAGNKEGLPLQWRSAEEPCIPMIIDLINEGLRKAADENDAKKEEASKSGGFHQGDAMSDWLKGIVKECLDHEYNPRAATEITPLISMAPNERSGVLGTMDKAFIPFKNAAVRERTMSCDFVPADLRGMIDPTDGEMKPVTLYVCVNQAEAAAFATITSLLYEVLSREFLAYGPKETNKNGVTLGPYPVCFMLDEFAKLPRIESVMTGPDLGRSKKTYYCLVAQSDSQIGKIYSKEDQQIIYATTAVKFVLPQNDEGTISLIQKMVGDTTIRRSSFSKSKGADFKEWGKSNESIALEKVSFIRSGDISSMKVGTHMLICQGFMSRPYILKSTAFYLEPSILAKAWNPRTGIGPKSAPPMPEHIRQKRVEETLAKRNVVRFDKYSTPLDGEGVLLDA